LSKDARAPYHRAMAFHAYLLRYCDGSYYAGHTDGLELRMAQHADGTTGGYTATRRPVWSDTFPTRIEALAAERIIKGWSRAKKQALIRGDWVEISRPARNRQRGGR
jgi:predicted GIY-YIG superfamily endonuclease